MGYWVWIPAEATFSTQDPWIQYYGTGDLPTNVSVFLESVTKEKAAKIRYGKLFQKNMHHIEKSREYRSQQACMALKSRAVSAKLYGKHRTTRNALSSGRW
jgi:hypothetical protein